MRYYFLFRLRLISEWTWMVSLTKCFIEENATNFESILNSWRLWKRWMASSVTLSRALLFLFLMAVGLILRSIWPQHILFLHEPLWMKGNKSWIAILFGNCNLQWIKEHSRTKVRTESDNKCEYHRQVILLQWTKLFSKDHFVFKMKWPHI